MLYETDVINAVCEYLVNCGYTIEQRLEPTQRGDDIVARKTVQSTHLLYVEAKGETSSRKNSQRYGKPFSRGQIRVHVGEALFRISQILSREHRNKFYVGIALPYTDNHRDFVNSIMPVLKKLQVAIFWVDKNYEVQFISNWKH